MSEPSIKVIPTSINQAIQHAFKVQLSAVASVAGMSMEPKTVEAYTIDCLSTLTLTSSTHIGSLSLGFPTSTYLALLERMLGESFPAITSENSDAASEILNIVFASARKQINEAGFNFEPAIPTTIIGQNLSLSRSNLSGHALFFQCKSDLGDFLVMLALKMKPKEEG